MMSYSDGIMAKSKRYDVRMQISMSSRQKKMISRIKPENASISEYIRQALMNQINLEVNKKELIREYINSSIKGKPPSTRELLKWQRDIRRDRL